MPRPASVPARLAAAALPLTAATLGTAAITSALLRQRRRIEFRDRVALITGGSRGLGLILARQLLDLGAKVAICSRAVPTLRRAEADLLLRSPNVLAVPADVTRPYDIELLLHAVHERFGAIDLLINNAATIQVGPAEDMTEDDYRNALDTIFWSAYRTTEAVLPEMRKRGSGMIANVASVGGLIPAPHLAPYVTAKHALVGYSRSMHNELSRDGIRVTTITPGLMRTGSPRNAEFKGYAEAEYAWFKLADSLPLTSMSADRAGRKILDAIEHGDAELTLTLSAQFGSRVQAMLPNLSARVGAMLNRLLPAPRPSTESRVGRDVETPVTASRLTALTDSAGVRNNQF